MTDQSTTERITDRKRQRWMEIGKAIERACEELPEGFDLHLELERGAATIRLYYPDADAFDDEWSGDEFHEQINNAINTALSKGDEE